MDTCNVIVDLSHHNAAADLVRAKAAGILGVLHKATQGTGFSDPAYSNRQPQASDAGLLWGAYHFGTGADPVAQAKFFLRTANVSAQNLLILDFEQNESTPANSMSLDQAHTFIKTVQDATGITPGLYGGAYLKQQLNGGEDEILQACWLWWAQYAPEPSIPPNLPDWTLWQYTDGHNGNLPRDVDGIGDCDRDQYQGTADDLQVKWATGTLAN